jgi:hypothetical protein
MPAVRLRLLAATLLAGALVASIAVGGLPGIGTSAAATAADSCTAVPADTSASASPSASPGSLCVSVTGAQSSVSAGEVTDWTVEIWAQGPVPSTVVALTVDQGGLAASFTGCPSGDGTAVCYTGNLGIGSAPTMYQMQAQIPIPSSANISSVTLTATASAATNPAMSANPQAGETMTVTTPAPSANPTPASSATSGAASPSATPASSASSASTSPGTSSSSTTPGRSSSSATASPVGRRSTGAPSTGLPIVPPGLVPSLGPMPVDPNSPAPELLVPTGTIADMLPLIAPSPSSTPQFSPASAVQALPVTTTDSADSRASTIGMSVGAAQDIGLIFLFIALLLAGTRIARRQPAAVAKANGGQPTHGGKPSQGKRSGPGIAGWSRFVTRRHWHRPHFHRPRRTRQASGDGSM